MFENVTGEISPGLYDETHPADLSFDSTAKCLHEESTIFLSLTAYPVLLFICTLGNSVNIAVVASLTKLQIKEVLLITLSVSDLLLMCV